MEFIETPIFTKLIQKLISSEEYHLLQLRCLSGQSPVSLSKEVVASES